MVIACTEEVVPGMATARLSAIDEVVGDTERWAIVTWDRWVVAVSNFGKLGRIQIFKEVGVEFVAVDS